MDIERRENWPCPKCAVKNLNGHVQLWQINSDEALFVCDGKNCLYPLESLKRFPIVSRSVGDIPVTRDLLQTLSLPAFLMNEVDLRESHLIDLIELDSLKNHITSVYRTKLAWESFVDKMSSVGHDLPDEFRNYKDVDLDLLENIRPAVLPFCKQILESSNTA